MRSLKNLEKIFFLIILISLSYMAYSWYESYRFKTNPLSDEIQKRIQQREKEVLSLIYTKYRIRPNIPLLVSDEFHSNLYGLTSYKNGQILIFLNKKRFKESVDYMIEEVIPHEYAHAMVFILGEESSKDGHTKAWQRICRELDAQNCERYVDNEEIIRQKMY